MSFTDKMLDRVASWIENRKDPAPQTYPYTDLTAAQITVTHTGSTAVDTADTSHVTTFTAYFRGDEIGSVKVTITSRGYGYVHAMYVIPRARRHGAGHTLMSAVTGFYGNVCRMELVPHSPAGDVSDQVLTDFYGSHGFVLDRTIAERGTTRPSDAYRMSRQPV